jgi:hypothetical protein
VLDHIGNVDSDRFRVLAGLKREGSMVIFLKDKDLTLYKEFIESEYDVYYIVSILDNWNMFSSWNKVDSFGYMFIHTGGCIYYINYRL